jgi:hypothetical protein
MNNFKISPLFNFLLGSELLANMAKHGPELMKILQLSQHQRIIDHVSQEVGWSQLVLRNFATFYLVGFNLFEIRGQNNLRDCPLHLDRSSISRLAARRSFEDLGLCFRHRPFARCLGTDPVEPRSLGSPSHRMACQLVSEDTTGHASLAPQHQHTRRSRRCTRLHFP